MIGGIQEVSFVDYPKKISTVLFVKGCNFRCPYCHNGHLVKHETTINKELSLDYLRNNKHLIDAVVVSGGEPTIYPNFLIELLRDIKEMGYLVKLDTNGSNPRVLSKIFEEKLVDYVAMDIKGHTDIYSKASGTKVDIINIFSSINLIRNSGVEYEFRTTVIAELFEKEDVLKILEDFSISNEDSYYVQQFKDTETVLAGKNSFTGVNFLKELEEGNLPIIIRN